MKKEIRNFTLDNIEVRTDDNGKKTVVGYGAVFNSLSNDLGGFKEIISSGAFEGRLEDDVRFLINHDGMPLGRTKSGTLDLSVDDRGLKYEVELPDTQTGRDLIISMERGDITQSSFAFIVEDDSWADADGQVVRTIHKVSRLFDVSAVTYPAYEEASVALRSMENWKVEKDMKEKVEKEKKERDKEELDLHFRSLAELRLNILKKK